MSNVKSIEVSKAPAVSRAIRILRHLAQSDKNLGVNEIARIVEIVPSSCLHILRELNSENLVSYDPDTKKYSLGAGILSLARQYGLKNPFSQAVRPVIERIAERHPVMVVVAEHSRDRVSTVVAIAGRSHPFTVRVEIGARFMGFAGASGRCVAAYSGLSKEKLKEEFEKVPWAVKPKFNVWLKEVLAVHQNHFAEDNGNYIKGITIRSVPIFDSNKQVRRSISAIDFTGHMRSQEADVLVTELIEAAHQFNSY